MPDTLPTFTIADRMRKARQHAGLSVEVMAAELGISRNTVTNYESGRSVPTDARLNLWSRVTGVPVDWLKGVTVRYSLDLRELVPA